MELLDKMKPLKTQCSSKSIIRIMQICVFKIVWEDKKEDFRYYSNIELKHLLTGFLSSHNIPASDFSKYGVKIGNQVISLEFNIPFEGINDIIEIIECKSICIGKSGTIDRNEFQGTQSNLQSNDYIYKVIFAGSRREQNTIDLPGKRSRITFRLNGNNYTWSSVTNHNIRVLKKEVLTKVFGRSLSAGELSKYALYCNGNRLDESKTVEDLHLYGKIVECTAEGL